MVDTPTFQTVFNQQLFPTVTKLAKDGVPNIRMGIAKCLSSTLTSSLKFDTTEQYDEAVKTLRQLQCDSDCDVREMAICSALPPLDTAVADQTATFDGDETIDEHQLIAASISNASTVDMNCTDEDGCGKEDGDDGEVSQDIISCFLDTDEKNTSM